MRETFFISDLHLNHDKMVALDELTGERYRPFETVEEMNEKIIENINSMVTSTDTLYILGDVVFKKASSEHLLARINGRKRLILGNHDEINSTSYYLKYFKKIVLWEKFGEANFVCSHMPLHPTQFRGLSLNVHGHVHKDSINDVRYMNVSVENTKYKPVHYETLRQLAQLAKVFGKDRP